MNSIRGLSTGPNKNVQTHKDKVFIPNLYRPFRAHAMLFPQFTRGSSPSLMKAATIAVTPSIPRTEKTPARDPPLPDERADRRIGVYRVRRTLHLPSPFPGGHCFTKRPEYETLLKWTICSIPVDGSTVWKLEGKLLAYTSGIGEKSLTRRRWYEWLHASAKHVLLKVRIKVGCANKDSVGSGNRPEFISLELIARVICLLNWSFTGFWACAQLARVRKWFPAEARLSSSRLCLPPFYQSTAEWNNSEKLFPASIFGCLRSETGFARASSQTGPPTWCSAGVCRETYPVIVEVQEENLHPSLESGGETSSTPKSRRVIGSASGPVGSQKAPSWMHRSIPICLRPRAWARCSHHSYWVSLHALL